MDASLSQLITIAVILFIAIPVPLFIILHFITKWKQSREISSSDEQMLEDLWHLSQRLQERLESLEIILDGEMPDWRKNYEQRHLESGQRPVERPLP